MLLLTADFTHWFNWVAPLLGLLLLFLVIFVSPLLISRDKSKSVVDRLAEHDRIQRNDSVFEYYMRQGLGDFFTIALWVGIAGQTAYPLGQSEAKRQAEFFVRSTSPETVVLSIYGDYLITARFNREKKTVEKNIMVVKVADTPTVTMHSERIGPLNPEK